MVEHPRTALLVVYTERLDECVAFYRDLGLVFTREQHGSGPVHHAAVLAGGVVFELYPASGPEQATGRIRLGFELDGSALPGRRERRTDPDGRVVELTLRSPDSAGDHCSRRAPGRGSGRWV